MKATGIVRRLDDLGRIVIPKEIRRTMGVYEGSPLEMFVDEENKRFNKIKKDHFKQTEKEKDKFLKRNSISEKNCLYSK